MICMFNIKAIINLSTCKKCAVFVFFIKIKGLRFELLNTKTIKK